jgi:hypothetical protein
MNLQTAQFILSGERIRTYEQIAQGGKDPINLYLLNMQISASFHLPLHMCEIALRNTVDRVLSTVFVADWHTSSQFLRMIDSYHRVKLVEITSKYTNPSKGKVIAELTLGFWVNLLSPKYAHLWVNHFYTCFANYKTLNPLSTNPVNALNALHGQLKIINKLRNRIAHYEPILNSNLAAEYVRILNVIHYIDNDCAKWVDAKQRTKYYIKRLNDYNK